MLETFESFLKKNGLKLISRDGPDPKYFGNESVTYMGSNLRIDITKDRGRTQIWLGHFTVFPDKGYGIELIKALIEGTSPELMDLLASADYIQKNWQKIVDLFSRAQRKSTRQQLDALHKMQLQTMIPAWSNRDLEFEKFLLGKGLVCQCREAPEGAFGPRKMIYSNSNIAVRIRIKKSCQVELANLKMLPANWYDVRLVRLILLNRSDFKIPFPMWFEFIRDNWDKIVDMFSPQKYRETYLRLETYLITNSKKESAVPTSPQILPLWPTSPVPHALGQEQSDTPTNDTPTLTLFPAPQKTNNGSALLICPGGGYGFLASAHEGQAIAEWFNALGGTGLVLRYRIAPKYHHPAMLADVTRALRFIRHHAPQWHIDPNRIAIAGSSAGGHLASSLITHSDPGNPQAPDPIDRLSSRPNLAILLYPVISFTSHTHGGSRQNFLGPDADNTTLQHLYSNETQVTPQTPPTFLMHAADDQAVPIQNSLLFASALAQHKVPFNLLAPATGGHGFGLGTPNAPETLPWPQTCATWLKSQNLFTPKT